MKKIIFLITILFSINIFSAAVDDNGHSLQAVFNFKLDGKDQYGRVTETKVITIFFAKSDKKIDHINFIFINHPNESKQCSIGYYCCPVLFDRLRNDFYKATKGGSIFDVDANNAVVKKYKLWDLLLALAFKPEMHKYHLSPMELYLPD